MPKVPITMPQLGESMAEATIVAIKVQPGDKVAADQEIIEVETDKAVMGVTTPCPGEIAKIDAEVKRVYAVGAVLGYVEASEADAARFVKERARTADGRGRKGSARSRRRIRSRPETAAARTSRSTKRACRKSRPVRISRSIKAGVLPVPAGAKGAGYLSPRVKARMAELQLTQADLAAIQGSGNAGRVTIKDLESFLGGLEKQTAEDASAIRTGVADAMRRSWTRPLATVGRFGLSRSGAGRSKEARSKTRSGFVCSARARFGAGGNAGRGLAPDRRSRAALRVDRHRRRGGSAGRDHGSGHSRARTKPRLPT